MTHFPLRRDAFPKPDDVYSTGLGKRLCTGCGRDFQPKREWQRQCSPRCRQRAYVERRNDGAVLYYGA